MSFPALKDIEEARQCLSTVVEETGLVYNKVFSDMTGGNIFLKTENLQKTGSFKLRGAYNRIAHLTEKERSNGVVASSAGNHAQGVALAASSFGIKSTIVMPKHAPISKVTATKSYGAEVVLHGNIYDEAYQKAREIQEETGATFIHPFDDPMVIAGQGTIGLEILDDMPDVDIVIAPIGGGGLVSGLAIALKSIRPNIRVIGVQAANAPSMYESFKSGKMNIVDCIPSIADGISVKVPGNLTYEVIKKYVDDIVLVGEDEIAEAILLLMEKAKVVSEGAGAVPVAALLNGKINVKGKKVAAVISGGNIDVNILAQVMDRGLIRQGRKLMISTMMPDKPGTLCRMVELIAAEGANILSILHDRLALDVPIGYAKVEVVLETSDEEHGMRIIKRLLESGYKVN